jgi:tetratricopeptide (TPR) repeat protein
VNCLRRIRTACLGLALLAFFHIFLALSFGQTEDGYEKARAAFQSGQYLEAASLFEAVESAAPGKTDALLYSAKASIHLQKFPDAENALRRFLERNPEAVSGYYLLGYVLNRVNRPAESLEIYTKAAKITPPTGDDLKIVALDYELLNDNPEAIRWLERSVAMDPGNKEAWYYLGRAYYTASRIPDARAAFEQVLHLEPRDARAENNIGLIFESGGKTDDALVAYRNAIAWQKDNTPSSEQPYLNLGGLLVTLDRAEEAISPLRKAVELASTNSQCHLRLGTAYLHLNRLDEAKKELLEAVRLNPQDATAHYQLGRYYKQIKNMEAAKREFDRVSEIQSAEVQSLKRPKN